jgi:hypothetical protein
MKGGAKRFGACYGMARERRTDDQRIHTVEGLIAQRVALVLRFVNAATHCFPGNGALPQGAPAPMALHHPPRDSAESRRGAAAPPVHPLGVRPLPFAYGTVFAEGRTWFGLDKKAGSPIIKVASEDPSIPRNWANSSVGRALVLQARGHRFDPCFAHHLNLGGSSAYRQLG